MRFITLAASLLVAVSASALPAGQQADAPASATPPAVTIIGGSGSPVALAVARLVAENGTIFLECVLDNKTDEKLWRMDLLFLVYDSGGRRKTSEALTLPVEDRPLGPRLNRTVRFPLPFTEIEQEDVLRVGLIRVDTAAPTDAWADDDLAGRSDREMEAQNSPPSSVVSDLAGAPIVLSHVVVQADANGTVHGVSLVATNAATVPVLGFAIVAHVFSAEGKLMASVSKTFGRPVGLLPRASYPVELSLQGNGVSHGRVWVGLERTDTPAWRNPQTLEQAKAAMQPPGRHPAQPDGPHQTGFTRFPLTIPGSGAHHLAH